MSRVAKVRWLVAGVLLFAIASAAGYKAVGVGASWLRSGATIVLSAEAVDYGIVPVGSEVSRVLDIRNGGTSDLVIEKVTATCGCTRTALEHATLRPGESTKLTIYIRAERETSVAEGVRVIVVSNDLRQPLTTITASYQPKVFGLHSSIQSCNFGRINQLALPSTREFRITATRPDGEARKIDPVLEAADAFLSITSVSTDDEQSYSVRVELVAGGPSGDIGGTLVFRDRLTQESIEVGVEGYVRGEVFASPAALLFSHQNNQEIVRINCRDSDTSLVVTDVAVSDHLRTLISVGSERIQEGAKLVIKPQQSSDSDVIKPPRRVKGDLRVSCQQDKSGVTVTEVLRIPIDVLLHK